MKKNKKEKASEKKEYEAVFSTNDNEAAIFSDTETELAEETEKEAEAEPKKVGMVKKQKIMIITFSAVAVLLILAYLFIIHPILKEKLGNKEEPPPQLIDGEVYDTDGRSILIFPKIEKNSIQSIEVHNAYGSFTVEKIKDDSFYIKEHRVAPFSAEVMSSLAVDAGYPTISRRITTECEDFSTYGLAEENNPAYYVLTTVSGEKHTLYIGNATPGGGGYYCRYKDRSALYVITSSVSSTLLVPSESLITPILAYPLDQQSYAKTDEFIITKNGQPFIDIIYPEQENLPEEMVISAYEMIYPGKYVVNDALYSQTVLLSLCKLEGTSVLAAGTGVEGELLCDNEEIMAEYGFHDFVNVPYKLTFVYGDQLSSVAFAPSGVDGYYFAYSYTFDMIVLVEESVVTYLEWDLKEYVNSAIFYENIKNVSEITVQTAPGSYLYYNDKKYAVNEKFKIEYIESSTENKLICQALNPDGTVKQEYNSTTQNTNFIQALYGSILYMQIEDYADEFDISTLSEYAIMTVKKTDGSEMKYKFYQVGGRCVYTIDGVGGEFYIPLRAIDKVLVDSVRAAMGHKVDSQQKYPELPDDYSPAP